ncbi:MAG: carboxypeptidase-like regulatory domain-containing protein [Acidobacteriota bacterium]
MIHRTLFIAALLPLLATTALEAKPAAVSGQVVAAPATPLDEAKVYAYEVGSQELAKVATDDDGHFHFAQLPAGLYKVIAFKQGFAPAIEMLLRRRADERQKLELVLVEETADERDAEGYWAVRGRIPSDVLRDMNTPTVGTFTSSFDDSQVAALTDSPFQANMAAASGVTQTGTESRAQLTTADVGVRGALGEVEVGVQGTYQQLADTTTTEAGGELRTVAVQVEVPDRSRLSVVSSTGAIDTNGSNVDIENHTVRWSGTAGSTETAVTARYTSESNFYSGGLIDLPLIPNASETFDLEGTFSSPLSDSTNLRAGITYRQRDGLPTTLIDGETVIDERFGAYGIAGTELGSRVMVEYGLYSSVRDGSLSLMPHGGFVVDLGRGWEAKMTGSQRFDDPQQTTSSTHPAAFHTAVFGNETDLCREASDACYRVLFAKGNQDGESVSFGAVHREYAETLRLYFNDDFFNRLESLFVVPGDEVPEARFRMVRKISPKVLAKLESSFADGGGGIVYATDGQPLENQVRYLVASLDTRFQRTSTGVFVAFHHLEQSLRGSDGAIDPAQQVELQRLRFMLTQDLSVLANVPPNLAVQLQMELSRGATPYTLTPDDELYQTLTGGLSFSF